MKEERIIFLPGLNKQFDLLKSSVELNNLKILVLGSGSETAAIKLAGTSGREVELILEDYDSLMSSRLLLENESSVNVKMMDFEITDFEDQSFDIIYVQGSISNSRRNKIVKEIKRILKSEGILCVGEVVNLKKEPVQFILDIYKSSDLNPLNSDELEEYYSERNFEVKLRKDFSETLKNYYSKSLFELQKKAKELPDNEKSYYKKLLNRISHEAKAYLKQGADKFIGFEVLILKKL